MHQLKARPKSAEHPALTEFEDWKLVSQSLRVQWCARPEWILDKACWEAHTWWKHVKTVSWEAFPWTQVASETQKVVIVVTTYFNQCNAMAAAVRLGIFLSLIGTGSGTTPLLTAARAAGWHLSIIWVKGEVHYPMLHVYYIQTYSHSQYLLYDVYIYTI